MRKIFSNFLCFSESPTFKNEGVAEGDVSDPHDFHMQAEVAQIDVNGPNFATHLS